MGKIIFKKCHIQQNKLDVIQYNTLFITLRFHLTVMVASRACHSSEVTEILTQRSIKDDSFVWGLKWPHKSEPK